MDRDLFGMTILMSVFNLPTFVRMARASIRSVVMIAIVIKVMPLTVLITNVLVRLIDNFFYPCKLKVDNFFLFQILMNVRLLSKFVAMERVIICREVFVVNAIPVMKSMTFWTSVLVSFF